MRPAPLDAVDAPTSLEDLFGDVHRSCSTQVTTACRATSRRRRCEWNRASHPVHGPLTSSSMPRRASSAATVAGTSSAGVPHDVCPRTWSTIERNGGADLLEIAGRELVTAAMDARSEHGCVDDADGVGRSIDRSRRQPAPAGMGDHTGAVGSQQHDRSAVGRPHRERRVSPTGATSTSPAAASGHGRRHGRHVDATDRRHRRRRTRTTR
jgi:hypothetical protein